MDQQLKTYSPYQTAELEKWRAYLDANTALLREKFEAIVARYRFDNLPHLSESEQAVNQLEFYHGSGDLVFQFMAQTETNSFDHLFDGADLFPEIDHPQPICDFIYPDSLDVYAEEYRDGRVQSEQRLMLFAWLVENWQACGGHRCGIQSGTLENNSIEVFNLTTLCWNDFAPLSYFDAKAGQRVDFPFSRDLTPYEIAQNCKNASWCYMEKGDEFVEFGKYQMSIGTRSGKIEQYEHIPFTVETSQKSGWDLSNWLGEQRWLFLKNNIGLGYEEKPQPANTPAIIPGTYHWQLNGERDVCPPVTIKDILAFETAHGLRFPPDYISFLQYMNGSRPFYDMHFRVSFGVWKPLNSIYTFEELTAVRERQIAENKYPLHLLPVGTDNDGNAVLLGIQSNHRGVFYATQPDQPPTKISNHFQEFINNSLSISEDFNPKGYHVEKGNIGMIRQWLSEGWDINEPLSYNRPAIQLTWNETVKAFLLENGANT